MAEYTLRRQQRMPIDINVAWDFFTSPHNLKLITPSYLNFVILDNTGNEKIVPGQIISYHVSPILGIPLFWKTEIAEVRDREFFIDDQLKGPYRKWHHQHHFKIIPGGVEMTDQVDYILPLGPLGDLAHVLFVKKQIEGIFDYRYKVLEERFGKWKG